MKTSLYLSGLVLLASLLTSCIKEPPCPRNLQKVEFVLDSADVSLADYIALEPGDEVLLLEFEAAHFSMNQPDAVKSMRSHAIQRKYRFDGKSFVPAEGQAGFEPGKADCYYCSGDTEQRVRVLMYDNADE